MSNLITYGRAWTPNVFVPYLIPKFVPRGQNECVDFTKADRKLGGLQIL
jgi:hypothetical protein